MKALKKKLTIYLKIYKMLYKHIEEKAEEVLKNENFHTPGFDIFKLIKKLNIEVVPKQFNDDISGFLAINNGKVVISYNVNEGLERRRFTVAHELGHFFLHSKSQPLFVDKPPKIMYRNNASSTGEVLKEREANAFAAAILMPQSLIISEIDKLIENDASEIISKLAKKFKVSEQAMSFRLSNLGYYIG
ncbi:ImmA/IrrE family metallo-endopeptidase [Flavobacterium sp.]|uniref:ImmA/IrrE family metallo-endopeptidase n=1 Tax=Flavobacterium sp. TaxID=239 RepID=UPI002BFEC6B2|nr:ImmA/IrrE family metallo-endopeptidase [Flavobacterium sp.]HSD08858.1 ImmA/IrrE family metallo-endopeptidase [Flavobacterium sp.]